ncbi:MAG: hypothetical protein AAB433_18425 [Nitrospirota bacterium]
MAQARCPYCGEWFKPMPGKGKRQKTCGAPACQLAHKRALGYLWRAENPERSLGRQGKVCEWAEERGYWRGWRGENPGYVKRNREKTRERMQLLRAERRRARAVLGDPVGYLRDLKARCGEGVCKTGLGEAVFSTGKTVTAEHVCKTGLGGAAVVEVVDYLLAREVFAKQEDSDLSGAGAG